jgi:hypothetical protein
MIEQCDNKSASEQSQISVDQCIIEGRNLQLVKPLRNFNFNVIPIGLSAAVSNATVFNDFNPFQMQLYQNSDSI